MWGVSDGFGVRFICVWFLSHYCKSRDSLHCAHYLLPYLQVPSPSLASIFISLVKLNLHNPRAWRSRDLHSVCFCLGITSLAALRGVLQSETVDRMSPVLYTYERDIVIFIVIASLMRIFCTTSRVCSSSVAFGWCCYLSFHTLSK